ncbi:MAG: PQQ-binding-like beta-propeller repeat protein [Ktedonobacterales bacterium]
MRTAADTSGHASPPPSGGLLITGSHPMDRTMVEAVRLEDGLPVWWHDSRQVLSDLICLDDALFVISCAIARDRRNGRAELVALRARDGVVVWRTDRDRVQRRLARRRLGWWLRTLWRTSSPTTAWNAARMFELAGLPGYTNLAATGELVLVGAGSIIFAFRARSGTLRWIRPLLSGGDHRLIAARNGAVYIHGDRSALEALDARTGRVWWSSDQDFYVESLAASDTHVHLSGGSSHGPFLASLNAVDGTREHMWPLHPGEHLAALADDGTAYLSRGSRLFAVRLAEEKEIWCSAPLRDAPDDDDDAFHVSSVCVEAGGQAVFYGFAESYRPSRTGRAVVGALDARSGATRWEWRGPERPLPASGAPSLLAACGNVYVTSSAGIFALRGGDGHLVWQSPGGVAIQRAVVSLDSARPE